MPLREPESAAGIIVRLPAVRLRAATVKPDYDFWDVMTTRALRRATREPKDRFQLWARFLRAVEAEAVAEVGVYRGEFAAKILRRVPQISRYYMIDPWRRLDNWNKPANRDDERFQKIYESAIERTRFAAEKTTVLRGTTMECVDEVPDGALDFVYIDGDHTLRGIAIDLIRWYPKVRQGGWIAGDDFTPKLWQHGADFDPTLVFPFAVYFAEALGLRIHGLPFSQFLIEKRQDAGYSFIDSVGRYSNLDLKTLADLSAPEDATREAGTCRG